MLEAEMVDNMNKIEVIVPAVKSFECDFCLKYMHTSSIIHKYTSSITRYIKKRSNIFSSCEA